MWCKQCLLILFIITNMVNASDSEKMIRLEISALAEKMEILQSTHNYDLKKLQKEIEELRTSEKCKCDESTNERNERLTLEWARTAMHELRTEMKELAKNVNSSTLLKQLHSMHNQIKRAVSESVDMVNVARTQEARLDKIDGMVERLKYEKQEMKNTLEQLRQNTANMAKELRHKQFTEDESLNDVIESSDKQADIEAHGKHHHKFRHNKMIYAQITRLAHAQEQLDISQQSIQTQMFDHQRRLDRLEEPNYNLISAKIDLLELQAKVFSDRLNNNTMTISDFEKVHASMLELREDVEALENKIDKTIPEFRKEISKLDVCLAQLNAHFSYVKEDQDNLRQSVKAIAVSVSNALDRADQDRADLKTINNSVENLKARSKEHFYRLNDHILKSESIQEFQQNNLTDTIPLPELMGEVKELQPVQREYEDLVEQLPKDCSSISGPAGSYLIHPGRTPIDAWCDNGTTLIQRRFNGSIEFNRKFAEYVHGFGEPVSEFWLGLETVHQLTADNCSSMRIDMTDIYGAGWYAQYEYFFVGGADSGYVLDVGGFKGNASDAFEYQNHMEFSAIDRDRDISNTHCASNYEGGWWYSHCQHVNINGKYTLGLTWFDSARNEWIAIATSEMKMYRRPGCI